MKEKSNFFQKAQTLEFISLIGSGAGAIGLKHPIMCNGANLAYEKSVFKEKMLEKKFVSGEDVFLLHNLKKEYRDEILFLKNKDAIVQTNCLNNAKEFLNQRIRWQSKSKSYFDRDSIIVSLIVFFANSILLLNIFLAFSDIVFLYSFLLKL
jgi:cellulose synthase/poly-beta-1,6-N-acetylglucosamine synthase-like glycosyltransferase